VVTSGRCVFVAETDLAAGGRLRHRLGSRNGAPVFAVLGLALLGGALAVPAYETLLVAWGGTSLFVALLLQLLMTGPTLSATVTTQIYETMAGNARQRGAVDGGQYLPANGGTLATPAGDFEPIGARLLGDRDTSASETIADHLAILVDVLVNDLELAGQARATVTDETATVRVSHSRVATEELFDHPVTSVLAVGLTRGLDAPISADSTVEDGDLVVTLQRADNLLDGAEHDQHGEGETAEQ